MGENYRSDGVSHDVLSLSDEGESRGGKGYEFFSGQDIRNAVPGYRSLPEGKTSIELGSPEARAMMIVDRDSEVSTADGVTKSRKIHAEIHDRDTYIIAGQDGLLIVAIGDKLSYPRPARGADGLIRQGVTIGDGVIDADIVRVRPGDKLIIHAGTAHVHGTEPGRIAAALFFKREVPAPTPP